MFKAEAIEYLSQPTHVAAGCIGWSRARAPADVANDIKSIDAKRRSELSDVVNPHRRIATPAMQQYQLRRRRIAGNDEMGLAEIGIDEAAFIRYRPSRQQRIIVIKNPVPCRIGFEW
ncbi:hypothetical protein GCM10010836_15350 [Aminobacter aminovorans]